MPGVVGWNWTTDTQDQLRRNIPGKADFEALPRGGFQAIATALSTLFIDLSGEIETSHEVKSLAELPPAEAILLDVTPRQLLAIAGKALPAGYRRQLEKYRYGPGVFKVDWALSEPIPWQAEACQRAGTAHLGPSREEIACLHWPASRTLSPGTGLTGVDHHEPTRFEKDLLSRIRRSSAR